MTEYRPYDENSITTSLGYCFGIEEDTNEITSILVLEGVPTGTAPTLDVKVYNVDPGSFRKLAQLIAHTQLVAASPTGTPEDKMYAESKPAATQNNVANDRLTGLLRIEYTVAGTTPSFKISHVVKGKKA